MTECGHDLSSSDQGEPLDAIKVGVLDSHNALVSEQLLWVVVDQLSVDEHVHVVAADHLHLLLHLLFLGELQFRDLRDVLDLDPGAEHFDLVRIHRGVGDQDLGILHSLGLVHPNLLIQQET